MTTAQQTLLERFILSRWMYKCGMPMIDDAEYDALAVYMKQNGLAEEYLNRTYDEDEEPTLLMEKYAIESVATEPSASSFLVEERSTSIRPVISFEEMWGFAESLIDNHDFALSLKLDGINIKVLFEDGKMLAARTRGRESDGIDVTPGMKEYFRLKPDINIKNKCIVTGELFVPSTHLDKFRMKYDSEKFKSPRTAALSLIRRYNEFTDEELSNLQFVAFNVSGVSDTVIGTYEFLGKAGFETPLCTFIERTLLYEADFFKFKSYFSVWMNCMYELQSKLLLPADGLVLETNDMGGSDVQHNQYYSTQIALKFSHWQPSVYYGVVEEILLEQRRSMCNCRVRIRPLITDDGSKAQYINCYNPSFLFKNNLYVGATVPFERQSGTINVLKTDLGEDA